MGKPTGFIEFERKSIPGRDPLERIKDWLETYESYDQDALREQASRCMDCGTPYCHTGMMLNNMASGCPIGNLIPEFNDLVYQGQWEQAYERLTKTNNFPEFTGRVCPAPCENSCVAGIVESPVTIKNVECAIIEKAWEEGFITPKPPEHRTGKQVAIIGSGPAGLACADELNKLGHTVTVFERDDRIGGLLMYGIPSMKLEKKVIDRRIDLMREEGIIFKTNTNVGIDYPVEELKNNFDSIVLCCGATQPRDLPAPGRDSNGIYMAVEYLTVNTKALLEHAMNHSSSSIQAKGKDVVVIGGGDTGTDCVGTALRQECNSVTQLEIMPKPPMDRADDNPWPEWPKTFTTDYGQEEAEAKQGADPRQYLVMTKQFMSDDNGKLTGVEVVDIKWKKNENGHMSPIEKDGSSRILPAQLVFLAMGFLGPEQNIIQKLGLDTDSRSNVKAEYGEYESSQNGIFTAGDMRRGQSLIVWAINEGRGAAQTVDRYLMGANDPS